MPTLELTQACPEICPGYLGPSFRPDFSFIWRKSRGSQQRRPQPRRVDQRVRWRHCAGRTGALRRGLPRGAGGDPGSISRCAGNCNRRRPRSDLDRRTLDEAIAIDHRRGRRHELDRNLARRCGWAAASLFRASSARRRIGELGRMPIVQNENPLRPAELALPSNRVVVAIAGGLGNQMFQYAMARRFAHVNRAEAAARFGSALQFGFLIGRTA